MFCRNYRIFCCYSLKGWGNYRILGVNKICSRPTEGGNNSGPGSAAGLTQGSRAAFNAGEMTQSLGLGQCDESFNTRHCFYDRCKL